MKDSAHFMAETKGHIIRVIAGFAIKSGYLRVKSIKNAAFGC